MTGIWNVTIVTKTGSCEPQTSSTLTVADGKISAAGADVSGSIGSGVLCESRSMVHMRTVNSVATPDRGSGMGHQLAYRAAVGGKHPANKASRTPAPLPMSRRLIIGGRRFFCDGPCPARRARLSPARSRAWPAVWCGGGTVTLDDGSSERIRCRATYRVAGGPA